MDTRGKHPGRYLGSRRHLRSVLLLAPYGGLQEGARGGIPPLDERRELKLANLPFLRRLWPPRRDQTVHFLLDRLAFLPPLLKYVRGHLLHPYPTRLSSRSLETDTSITEVPDHQQLDPPTRARELTRAARQSAPPRVHCTIMSETARRTGFCRLCDYLPPVFTLHPRSPCSHKSPRDGAELKVLNACCKQSNNGADRTKGAKRVQSHWVDCERAFIAQRYDRIASLITLFDWLFFVPPRLRSLAAVRLAVQPGARVLEIGCGTGRNFPFLQQFVGPAGTIFGVDISAGMLAKARMLCASEHWDNVELTQCDAAEYIAPEPLDAILFGLCYNTMPHHLTVLRHAWKLLRPGGRIVIMDGKVPPGLLGRLALPFGLWLMKRTMLGNPFIKPWEHLSTLAENFSMEEFLFGSWYICWGMKPVHAQPALFAPPEQLIAAE
jgi:ubiquinone/menaquinone biosynthesis C-methylase UbiE